MKVIMISGKQGSGKTTLSEGLLSVLPYSRPLKMAGILYEMHDAVRDIGRKYNIPTPDKDGVLLQILGTELGRDRYGDDVWVNAVRAKLRNVATAQEFVIIDDIRFPNELAMLDGNNSIPDVECFKIRLEASQESRKNRCPAWRNNEFHPSETGLDDSLHLFDIVIDSDLLNKDNVLDLVLSLVYPEYKKILKCKKI